MNGQIIPEETEKSIEVKQENATFLVIGDKAYTSEIIEEYNRNAEAKTEDFNTNAENKTASYNSNTADRTTAFNNNYDNKISAFNSNANKQTEEFDSHVLMQTNTFNKNAVSTIANYNSNAEQKTTEFNQNALSYQEGIDANKKHIIIVSNELERVKNDVLETGTDTDTYIHLEDSAMAEYQELSVDGVCEQVTTSIDNGDEYDSPSPEHPQPIATIENSLKITSCNKNLMDPNKLITGYFINISNGTLVNSNIDNYVEYTLIKPNETYWKPSTNHFALYDKDKKFIKSGHGKKIITTPNSMYIRWTLSDGDLRLEQYLIQSEVEPTSFEQHLETQITANLPEGEFIGKINDTYKDTLKVEYNEEDGQYHLNLYKNVGKVVLDGSENWVLSGYTNEIILSLYINNYNNKSGNLISDKFIYRNSVDSTTITEYCSSGTNTIRIGILKTTCGTIEEFKNWLSTHNTEVYYALAEPYTLDLGVVDMPITYNEVTNLFTDSDLLPQINAKYYRNFISTIQNLQVNEKALKQELIDINNRLSALESTQTSTTQESEVVE